MSFPTRALSTLEGLFDRLAERIEEFVKPAWESPEGIRVLNLLPQAIDFHLSDTRGLIPQIHRIGIFTLKNLIGAFLTPAGMVLILRPQMFPKETLDIVFCHASYLEGFASFLLPELPPTVRFIRPIELAPPLNRQKFIDEAMGRMRFPIPPLSADLNVLFRSDSLRDEVLSIIENGTEIEGTPLVWYERRAFFQRLKGLLLHIAAALPRQSFERRLQTQLKLQHVFGTQNGEIWMDAASELYSRLPPPSDLTFEQWLARRVALLCRDRINRTFPLADRLNVTEVLRHSVPVAGAEGPPIPLPRFLPQIEHDAPHRLESCLTPEYFEEDLRSYLAERKEILFKWCEETIRPDYLPRDPSRVFRYFQSVQESIPLQRPTSASAPAAASRSSPTPEPETVNISVVKRSVVTQILRNFGWFMPEESEDRPASTSTPRAELPSLARRAMTTSARLP